MTLNELRYIVAVARERHFGRAAEACFVSQPTLSVAVRKLENELGVSLFERGQGEVNITAVGEEIVTQAQRILEEVSLVKQLASQGRNQLAGPVRLGAIYTIGPYLLPHLIPVVAEQAPGMPLIIEENYTSVLSQKLRRGDLDAIIISLPFEEPGILTQPLFDEPFIVLLPVSHPWAALDAIDIAELERENVLLLGTGHCFRDQVLSFCPNCLQSKSREGGLQHSLEGGSLETIRYMVASGVGLTVLPCTAAGADRFSERLVCIRRFRGASPSRRVALAWRKSFPRPEAIKLIRRSVLACSLSCVRPVED